MKKWIILFLRCVVALIFIVSGFEKLSSPAENFLYILQAYELFPDVLARLFSVVFPWIELGIGVFLLFGLWLRLTLAGLTLVSAVFIGVVGQAIIRGLPIDSCGCFGNLVHLPLHGVIFLDISIFSIAIACLRNIEAVRFLSLDRYYDPSRT